MGYICYSLGSKLARLTLTTPERVNTMTIDRSEASRAMAKAIAFKACGKDQEAEAWARRLVEILECADILGATR